MSNSSIRRIYVFLCNNVLINLNQLVVVPAVLVAAVVDASFVAVVVIAAVDDVYLNIQSFLLCVVQYS